MASGWHSAAKGAQRLAYASHVQPGISILDGATHPPGRPLPPGFGRHGKDQDAAQ